MNQRQIIYSFIAALVLTILCIFLFDQPIAAFVQRIGGRDSVVLKTGTSWLEIATGLPIARYFLTYVLLGLGAVFFIARTTRPVGWILLFVGSAQVTTRLVGGVLKEVFHRLRPFEVIQAANWDWKFFGDHGSSFPSGHSAHFWGLFFPLAFLFPRYRIPLAIIPVFICIARVGVNDHWTSDVIASIALAALVTLVFIWLLRMLQGISSAAAVTDERARPAKTNPGSQ
jgi:membrane-associated phospholipid phosphatase